MEGMVLSWSAHDAVMGVFGSQRLLKVVPNGSAV